jgi:putative exosortase-associated protein (TIGR04073 family)
MVMGWLAALVIVPPASAFGPFRKLSRGAANVATGWVELPAQIAWTTEVEGSVAGVSVGLLTGLTCGLRRTLVGVLEAATFVLPNRFGRYGDAYGPILEPTFVVLRPADRR